MKINEKGYTLIELLAAITILLIVIVPFTNLFFQGFKSNQENTQLLDTKTAATGIIEELKLGVIQSATTVEIGEEIFDISQSSSVVVENERIDLNNQEYLMSFSIKNYQLPNEVLNETSLESPNNLYKITLDLVPLNDNINYDHVNIETIIKR